MGKLNLSTFFKTKVEADSFSAKLDTVVDHVYSIGFNLDKVLTEELGLENKNKFLSLLRDQEIELKDAATLKTFLEKLQKEISELPVLEVSLSFEPKTHTLEIISNWFTINLGKQILFNITVNPKLIAGVELNYQGRFFTGSIKTKVEHSLSEQLLKIFTKTAQQKTTPAIDAGQLHQSPENFHLGR